MAVVDLFMALLVGLFIWYVVVPFAKTHIFTKDTPPLTGDLGAVEEKVNKATEAKQSSDQISAEAKQVVEDTLHKLDELKGKL